MDEPPPLPQPRRRLGPEGLLAGYDTVEPIKPGGELISLLVRGQVEVEPEALEEFGEWLAENQSPKVHRSPIAALSAWIRTAPMPSDRRIADRLAAFRWPRR